MADLVNNKVSLSLPPSEIYFTPEEPVQLTRITSHLMDVYVDDFILAGKPAMRQDLKTWARAAIWVVISVFPTTAHTRHKGGREPISQKNWTRAM
eukprot:1484101-Ditylum_brightwellii.AAC.1